MMTKRLSVADVMSVAIITVSHADTLSDAHYKMKMADVRHLPVVDADGKVIGILSDRDLLGAASLGQETPVGLCMSQPVHTITADMAAHEAAAIMLKHKIGSLPVVGPDRELQGLVTETDFLLVAHRALSEQAVAVEASKSDKPSKPRA
ncbi:MAG: CBS domain-containing protein [Myxococcales bacterium]|nr:CBS domain-containing protein [Myxococcales bacterium]